MKSNIKVFIFLIITSLLIAMLASCDLAGVLGGYLTSQDGNDNSADINDENNSDGEKEDNSTNIDDSTNSEENTEDNTDTGNNNGKRVPVYQGMTITSAVKTATLPSVNGNKEDFDYGKDNGNHNGHFKGDHGGKHDDEEIDKENPYPDNGENETLEEEVKGTLEVVGAAEEIYYATAKQDIYINIHINNPDNYEIISFTLNGKKYSSYMFEEGSDMETIVLKYNVGESHGVVEYTIDAIKYIDGTEIKDVLIDGDKTVKAGVRVEDQVKAEISDLNIDTNALSFEVNLTDKDSLIAFSNGLAKAVIYDGEKLVAEKDLVLGENSVTFDGLKTDTLYQYAVVAYYDDFSGVGAALNTLYKDALYTDAVVLFNDITLTQSSASFGFAWHESCSNGALTSLKLYKDNSLVREIDVNATTVDNLLSNNVYVLVAEYENLGKTESIRLELLTATNAVPEVSIVNPSATQTTVGFDIKYTDVDNVGAITKIELVHANGTVTADSTDVRVFENLLSNNEYMLKVTYTYDLNDGIGIITEEKKLTVRTLAKEMPHIRIATSNISYNKFDITIFENDSDNVGSISKLELIDENGNVREYDVSVRTFENLGTEMTYSVRVTYTYDLNDGVGINHKVYNKMVSTVAAFDYTVYEETATITGFRFDSADVIIPDTIKGYKVVAIGNYAFTCSETLVSITIPDTVVTIGWGAFESCGSLTNVNIPDSVTIIDSFAFCCCNLTNVNIPDSVKNIGDYVFDGCKNLETVTIGKGVIDIGESAFNSCNNLTSINIPDNVTYIGEWAFWGCVNLESVTIGDGVTTIDTEAFYGCVSLKNVTIGDSITSIGDSAFSYCSTLTSINYRGTEEEWNAISKGNSWDDYAGDYTITYNYTGE